MFALVGAVMWGVHYPLLERSLVQFSPATMMMLTGISFAVVVPFFHPDLFGEGQKLWQASAKEKGILFLTLLTEFIAILCVMKAITLGAATYVSIIESSYPVFVIVFSYLLFKDVDINMQSALGAGLIIAGITLVSLYGEGKAETVVVKCPEAKTGSAP